MVAFLNETSQKDNLLNLSVETEGYRINGAVETYYLEDCVLGYSVEISTCSCSDTLSALWGFYTDGMGYASLFPSYNDKGFRINPVVCLSSNMLAEKVVGDNGSELIHIEKKQI